MIPHNSYKDSGVRWIGKIPTHWDIIRLKAIGQIKGGLTYSPNDECEAEEGVLVLRSSNIQNGKLTFDDNVYVNKVLKTTDYVKKDDILICSRNGSAALVGKCALIESNLNAVFGAFMMIFRPQTKINSKYIFYLAQICINKYKATFSTSTINQLTKTLFANIHAPYTNDIIEQLRIVEYLDAKTSAIDACIEALQKQSEAYVQLRRSIIHQAITYGLEPNVTSTPAHWEAKRIKDVFNEIAGCGFPEDIQGEESGDLPVCKASDISKAQGQLYESANYISFEIAKSYGFKIVPAKSILFPKIGEAMRKNSRAFNQMDCCIDNNCEALIPQKDIIPAFAYYLLSILDMRYFDNGGTIPCVNMNALRGYLITLPSIPEQQAIVDYLDAKCEKIDKKLNLINQQIDAYKRLRRALINEVITGKREIN